jgi:hypothetical protein
MIFGFFQFLDLKAKKLSLSGFELKWNQKSFGQFYTVCLFDFLNEKINSVP